MTVYNRKLGYAGAGYVDGTQVLVTSHNFEKAVSKSFIEAYSLPNSITSRSKMLHADGTVQYTGSIGFDVTADAMSILTVSKLLARNYTFQVKIHDGEAAYEMNDCKASSVALSGATGGLIACSLSFMGPTDWSAASTAAPDFIRDSDTPYGYWYSGNTDVISWSLSYNQDLAPRYGNEDSVEPLYVRGGLISYTLQVETYSVQLHGSVTIATSTFTLTGTTTAKGYNFGGPTSLGTYTHTFETAASAASGSDGVIIT